MKKAPPYTGAITTLLDPHHGGTVYVTTSKSGLFKSIDCGATWAKVNTGRNGDQIDQGEVWSAVLDPVDPAIIYALTGYGPAGVWKSTNGGVDWDNILPTDQGMPGFVGHMYLDPTDHQHLLINFHDNCTGGHTPVCFGETKDGGKTWAVLDFPTSLKNSWGEGTSLLPIDATHWLYENWELYYTADAGKTWSLVDTGGAAAIAGGFYRAADGSYWLASAQGILTSADGAHWTRIPNSYGGMDGIVGCGGRLYGAAGFQPPQGNEFTYTALLADSTRWSVGPTAGLPLPMVSGISSITCASDHALLYVSALGAGLWRMVAAP